MIKQSSTPRISGRALIGFVKNMRTKNSLNMVDARRDSVRLSNTY